MSSDSRSILASASYFIITKYSFPYIDETGGLNGCLSALCLSALYGKIVDLLAIHQGLRYSRVSLGEMA